MAVEGLNHIAVRTSDMNRVRDFYVQVLGFAVGERPPFPFPGYWLYCGNSAVIHIIGTKPGDDAGLEGYLGSRDGGGGGALDHVAFTATDVDEMRDRLQRHGVAFTERTVPLLGLRQLFVKDPEGTTLELNFPETTAA